MIYINQVLQYTADSQRIRIIEIEESYAYVVNIDTTSAMPNRELYSHLEIELEQGELLRISDPFAKAIPDYELTSVQISKRDEDWATVENFILPNMKELLKKKGREVKIVEITAESGLGKTKVKKLPLINTTAKPITIR